MPATDEALRDLTRALELLDSAAAALEEQSGFKPTTLIVPIDLAELIRSIRSEYPGVLAGEPPPKRPVGFPPKESWLGSHNGIEIYASSDRFPVANPKLFVSQP